MPFAVASFPFTAVTTRLGTGATVRGPTAGFSRLDASLLATVPLGSVGTVASLGFDAGFSPRGAASLRVNATARSVETALVFAAGAYASGFAGLRIVVEEFLPSGAFARVVVGPMTTVFDFRAVAFGLSFPFQERRIRAASIVFPIVGGRFYRAWVDSVQAAFAQAITGPASAVSNVSYGLDPVFFEFR
jgi:hypothetical protein